MSSYKAPLFEARIVRVPGLMFILPDGDLEEAFEASEAVRAAIEAKLGLWTGVQGRFVFVPTAVPEAMTPALAAAKKALRGLRRPSILVGLFGDLSTLDVEWANLDKTTERQVAAVAEEIRAFRSVTRPTS